MATTLRLALTETDRAAAFRLRYEIYVEDQKLFLDEADHARRWLRDGYDPYSRIFLAEVDGEVVGTSRITLGTEATFSQESREAYDFERFSHLLEEHDLAVVTRLVVRHEHRGGKLGFRLLEACWQAAARENIEVILGNCAPHLVSYYLPLAFQPFGALKNHPSNGTRVRVAVVTGDYAFLERFNSPMRPALRQRTKPTDAVPGILAAMAEGRAVLTQEQTSWRRYWAEVRRHLATADGDLRGALAGLSQREAKSLMARSQLLTCCAGDELYSRGHTSRTVYVLLEGSLVVRCELDGTSYRTIPGSLVGETAFLGTSPRLSDVIAGPEGARVLALNDHTLRKLVAEHLTVSAKFLHVVARSLCQRLVARADRGQG